VSAAAEGALTLSALPHTWLIDLDGTVLRHNGHLTGGDELLPGVLEFWATLPAQDAIVLLSAREPSQAAATLAVLDAHGLRYDHALFGLPKGERVLINDRKPSGLPTACAINLRRDEGLRPLRWSIDPQR
jgi:hypothetical protein